MPRVSVIIPTYNRSGLVKEAVESVLAQTFKNLEVIVVDDGSTDDTRNVIEGIGDERVKYFHKQNGGVSSARNFGIQKAQGQYIAFLDSDDLWPENFLDILISRLDQSLQYNIAYTSVTLVSVKGTEFKSPDTNHCKSGNVAIDLFKKGFIWISATVLRRQALGNIRFDESLSNAEDSDILLRLSAHTQFLYVPDVRIIRRSTKDSLSCSAGINCNRILSLERFYFRLGGKRIIPPKAAKLKLSHACRRIAERYRKNSCKAAAVSLYKRAIKYYPLDVRLYPGLIRALCISAKDDKMPNWKMPEPLQVPEDFAL